MNPNEWFGVELYTSSNDGVASQGSPTPTPNSVEEYKALESEVTWNCHLAGVKCPASLDLDLDFQGYGFQPWYLSVHLAHMGWSVHALVFFTTVNLIALVVLAQVGPLGNAGVVTRVVLLAAAVPMSLSFAEILVYWLIPQMIPIEQDWGVQAIFWTDLAVLIFLALIAIREKKENRRRRTQEAAEELRESEN
jgi:hypothetical protein